MFNATQNNFHRLLVSCASAVDDVSVSEALTAADPSALSSALSPQHLEQLTSALAPLCPEQLPQLLQRCLSSCDAGCALFANAGGSADAVSQMVAVGRFMGAVGLLQSYVMTPQGPVDPVQVLRIRLEHVRKQVRAGW